jgi:CubicO group peptidase (beta-lactamase class C family)
MKLVSAATVLLLLAFHGLAADEPGDVTELLRDAAAGRVPGIAGAIVRGDGMLEAVGADGVRELDKPEKVTIDDRWHLGSCTKAMTATLCAMLVEDGKLSFEQTVAKTWPDAKTDPAWRDVPLWLFLHHRSGAVANTAWQGLFPRFGLSKSPAKDREQYVKQLLAAPPESPPGAKYVYSNAGFTAAGAFAEKAAGKAWEDLMRERLFNPLGMKSAGFGPPGAADAVDQPHGHTDARRPVRPGPNADNPPVVGPAGTVHASIGDWAKFVALHVSGERKDGARLLKPETFVKLHEPVGDEPKYAAGWMVLDRSWGGRVLTHSGSNTMWYCVTWLAPEKDFAVLVCCNQAGEAAAQACDDAAGALIRDHAAHARAAK